MNMSDPVSNVEIEDVLSSIRRLISEKRQVEDDAPGEVGHNESGRLVLTPALRVASDPGDDIEPEGHEDAPDLTYDTTEEPGLAGFAEIDAGEIQEPVFVLETPEADQEESTQVEEEEEPSDQHEEPEHLADDPEDSPEDGASPPQHNADEGETIPERVQSETDGDKPAGGNWDAEFKRLEAAALSDFVAPRRSQRDLGSLSAKIEALEAAVAQTDQQWEPDGEGVDDYAGTEVETLEWRDHEDREPADGATGSDSASIGPNPLDTAEAEDGFIDEDALRDMVADIVRQELQGALGERITRNVRKLVRREIHRAMASHELD